MPGFYQQEPGAAFTATIDKYVYVCLHTTPGPQIRVMFDNVQELNDLAMMDHRITKSALETFGLNSHITVTSISDITTRGSGLGSSSAFTVGLVQAILEEKGYKHDSPFQLADIACDIEINRCHYNIGKQDQYATALGGMNLFTFDEHGRVSVQSNRIRRDVIGRFQENLILVHTGQHRSASDVLDKQTKAIAASSAKFQLAKKNKDRAWEAVKLLEAGDTDSVGALLHDSWMDKKQITDAMSSQSIDAMYDCAIKAGALGGKILGAGGGGFAVFYATPDHRKSVVHTLQQHPSCQVYDFAFTSLGSRIVYNG